jgi:radical SAM protein with 4Fe4S-binding SPASM domain
LKICPFVPDGNHSDVLARTRLVNATEDFLSFRRETESIRNSSFPLRGKCSTCDMANTCKGGCIAQKLVHGRDAHDEQPVCIRDVFNASLGEHITSGSCRKLIGHWLYLISLNTIKASPWCPRQLPWWLIDLSGTQRASPSVSI